MAFYRKNIRSFEQVVRIAIGLMAAAASTIYLSGWLAILVAVGGIAFVATGLVGYCPMCAMAGINWRNDV